MTALPWPIWANDFLVVHRALLVHHLCAGAQHRRVGVLRRAGALSGVSQQGLTPQEIGILIVFCSLTFTLGTLLAAGVVLILKPQLLDRLVHSAGWVSLAIGCGLLALIALYVFGAWRQLPPWRLGKWHIQYPRLPIVGRQLLAGPLELLCAAAIIYFALPTEHNPGYLTVLGVFLASFSLALLSRTRRACVLELTFLSALPEVPKVDVLAALIVFRGFYLLLPFALAMVVVLVFEFDQWRNRRREAPIR